MTFSPGLKNCDFNLRSFHNVHPSSSVYPAKHLCRRAPNLAGAQLVDLTRAEHIPRRRPTNTGIPIVVQRLWLCPAVEHVTQVLHALPSRVKFLLGPCAGPRRPNRGLAPAGSLVKSIRVFPALRAPRRTPTNMPVPPGSAAPVSMAIVPPRSCSCSSLSGAVPSRTSAFTRARHDESPRHPLIPIIKERTAWTESGRRFECGSSYNAWSAGMSSPLHILHEVHSWAGPVQNGSTGPSPSGSSTAEHRYKLPVEM